MRNVDDLRIALRVHGPARAPDLQKRLGISQPELSRAMGALGDEVLRVGRARRTTYAARRDIEDVEPPLPVYEIGVQPASTRQIAVLHPIHPRGVWVEGLVEDVTTQFFDDLPWFLFDVRPSGYLGRLVPQQHPEMDLPPDILRWSGDDVLRYLSAAGWGLPGALVIGDTAYQRFLEQALDPVEAVELSHRATSYAERARDVLQTGTPGSSAAGERPKFLATVVRDGEPVPVLVKFSPPTDSAVGERIADLLIAESLALEACRNAAIPAAPTEVLVTGERVFLESERFDRVGSVGRRGVASLLPLDAQFVGSDLSSWTGATEVLCAEGHVSEADHRRVRWLQCFGSWIGNTDMHHGNLSFFLQGTTVDGLAPAYDMGPMAWFPRSHELVEVHFDPPLPTPSDRDIARSAWSAADQFWATVAEDARISSGFRSIAGEARACLARIETAVDLLPG